MEGLVRGGDWSAREWIISPAASERARREAVNAVRV